MAYRMAVGINGVERELTIEAHRSLLSVLREDLGLTGPKEGCDDSECGACMVLIDGAPVNACSYLAAQADGREVTTVEGVARGASLNDLQRIFLEEGAAQCGFCTPGVIISAEALLATNAQPTEDDVRTALSGNLCRCTGYQKIIRAVLRTADERSGSAG
ncbi:MAG: aerobic carbon-monoxide dehydrogenase small subunit [Solirubrobacteraceae bacterium]|jgi:carbon-monoxide dehydrogenase small subunit|nr:aerobic carbon-monoxide dehydrogenase small subunit [Solirubrobacteraceae bacterium]MEA2359265.1 aerobic carbon-monoxide dehydrogenase small subunit [Solirubrobacteraceae bacterium]